MPSDSNGVYSLPPGYLAEDGETIQPSQHNPPLEDIATAITGRLPRNGNAAMTGALKITDGSVTAPGLAFGTSTNSGFYKTATGFGVAVNGVLVFEFTAVPSSIPVGAVLDWATGAAPSGWLLCQGQSLLIATYPALYAVISNFYGAVDGTHFTLPDLRGRVTAGYDPTGGTLSANFGTVFGVTSNTLAQANLPNYVLPDTLGVSRSGSVTLSAASNGVVNSASGASANMTGGGGALLQGNITVVDTQAWSKTGSVTLGGSATPVTNLQPTIVLNKIIFTGVA